MDEFDVIVVGGGSAGCVLAGRLSEDAATRVLLLEAGGEADGWLVRMPAGLALMLPWPINNWALRTVPQPGLGGRRGYQPRGKGLGGSSAINAMVHIRGRRSDYDGWDLPGWRWSDVAAVFQRLERNSRGRGEGPLPVCDQAAPFAASRLFLAAAGQAGFPANDDFNGPVQEGFGLYQVTQAGGERWSAARAFLAPARARPNLTVVTGARATRILLDGRRATGVAYRAGRRALTARARREVVLAAGVFMTPQLLMLSGIGPAAHLRQHGIDVVCDLPGVGANLQDHIDHVTVYTARPGPETLGMSAAGGRALMQAARDWRRDRSGALTSPLAEAGGFVRSEPGLAEPDLQLHFAPGFVDDHGRRFHPGHGFSCHVSVLAPASRGVVSLATPDPLAAPAIDPRYLSDAADLARLVRGFRIVRRILEAPALAPIRGRELYTAGIDDDARLADCIRARADTLYHPVGTARMGRDGDPLAVLDPRLRVRGIAALRVADAAAMPAIVSGNTNAAAMMIGWTAADLMASAR